MDRRWRRVDVEVHIDVHIHTSLLIISSFHFALFPPGNSEMAGCSSSGKGGMMVVVAWKRCVTQCARSKILLYTLALKKKDFPNIFNGFNLRYDV